MEPAPDQDYYPRLLGLASSTPSPTSGRQFELLVTGTDQIGALAKLSAILAHHEVNLTFCGGYYILAPDTFVWTAFIDLTHSKSSIDRVLRDLRRLDFVSEVKSLETRGESIDRFLFPVIIHGDRRGIIMGLQSLQEEETQLTRMLGPPGAVIMFELGRAYANGSIEDFPDLLKESRPKERLDLAAAWLRMPGWGVLTFNTAKFDRDGSIRVKVTEPPSIVDEGKQESYFLRGLITAIIEFVLKKRVNVASASYDGPSRSLQLTLRAST